MFTHIYINFKGTFQNLIIWVLIEYSFTEVHELFRPFQIQKLNSNQLIKLVTELPRNTPYRFLFLSMKLKLH